MGRSAHDHAKAMINSAATMIAPAEVPHNRLLAPAVTPQRHPDQFGLTRNTGFRKDALKQRSGGIETYSGLLRELLDGSAAGDGGCQPGFGGRKFQLGPDQRWVRLGGVLRFADDAKGATCNFSGCWPTR